MEYPQVAYREGRIFELLPGCGLASIRLDDGNVIHMDRETRGVDFDRVRRGSTLRCAIDVVRSRAVHAELIEVPDPDTFALSSFGIEGRQPMPLVPRRGRSNPLDAFLRARSDAIHWLRTEEGLNDEDISKTINLDPTEVFLVRALEDRAPPMNPRERTTTEPAPLGLD